MFFSEADQPEKIDFNSLPKIDRGSVVLQTTLWTYLLWTYWLLML